MAVTNWESVTIESLLDSGAITGHKDGNHGSQYPRVEEFDSIGVPFLTAKSLSDGKIDINGAPRLADEKADKLRLGFVRPGDVLLSHNATVGRVAIVPEFKGRVLIGTSLTYFRLNASRISPLYLAAYFSGADFQNQLAAVMSQTTRNQVPITAQRQLRIVLPPIAEQEAIAHVLGSLDDKIDLNRRMNETLESMARAIFKSWFVDFDPVRAKMAGRKPVGIDPKISALFPGTLRDSVLGSIPEGWREGRLQDIAEVVMGSSPPGDTYNETADGVPLVNGPVEFGEVFAIKRKWTTAPAKLCQPRDLIFCVRGSTTGRRVLADEVFCLGRGVCAIRSTSGAWCFTKQLIDSTLDRLLAKVSGSVFPNLNGPDIKDFAIVIPPHDLVRAYQSTAEPLLDLVCSNCKQSESLAAMRDTLLPKLLSGEIRVKEAEKLVGAKVP